MTQEHPITPPPELTQEWSCDCPLTDPFSREFYVATQAARWGADQELEACVSYVDNNFSGNKARALRAVRRPKPPSLKELALQALDDAVMRGDCITISDALPTIRRALEQLDD